MFRERGACGRPIQNIGMFLFKRTDIELIAGIFGPGPEFGVDFFKNFEKFRDLKNFPRYGFLIFLKILKI